MGMSPSPPPMTIASTMPIDGQPPRIERMVGADRLEAAGNAVTQVQADDDRADHVEEHPERIPEHLDLGAIEVADRRRADRLVVGAELELLDVDDRRTAAGSGPTRSSWTRRSSCGWCGRRSPSSGSRPAAPRGSPPPSAPPCRCGAGTPRSSPISIGMISGFEISLCEYSLKISAPAKISALPARCRIM